MAEGRGGGARGEGGVGSRSRDLRGWRVGVGVGVRKGAVRPSLALVHRKGGDARELLGGGGGGGGAGRGYPFFALVHREGGDARELLGGGGACQLRRWRRQLQRRRTAHGGENGQAAEHCR